MSSLSAELKELRSQAAEALQLVQHGYSVEAVTKRLENLIDALDDLSMDVDGLEDDVRSLKACLSDAISLMDILVSAWT